MINERNSLFKAFSKEKSSFFNVLGARTRSASCCSRVWFHSLLPLRDKAARCVGQQDSGIFRLGGIGRGKSVRRQGKGIFFAVAQADGGTVVLPGLVGTAEAARQILGQDV